MQAMEKQVAPTKAILIYAYSCPYLQKDLNGEQLLVTFLEEDGEDTALPHLVQDADAQRGGSDGQQHQQQNGTTAVAAA
ncbi:hypothetical protein ACP70R_010396 [Stipagrostis hirtigluma subsp. patula]